MEKTRSDRRTNVLQGRPLEGRISEACLAPAEDVYALLADVQRHLEWGGTRRSKRSRLLSIQAPAGPAAVGTEFTSTGEDSMCLMSDRSVVTEAIPSRAFGFVTESSCQFRRSGKGVDWTIVHRYDITPDRRLPDRLHAPRHPRHVVAVAAFTVPCAGAAVDRRAHVHG
jgi:hypothetical protein